MIRQNSIIVCLLAVAIALGVVACGQDEGPFSPAGQDVLSDATVTIDGVTLVKWNGNEGLLFSDDDSDDDSDSSDDESDDSDDNSDDGSDDSDDDSSDDGSCYDVCDVDSSGKTIKTTGGSLTIPPGALKNVARISMKKDDQSDGVWSYRTGFEFGPSGLQFEQPATLTIAISPNQLQSMGLNPERLRIAYVQGDDHDDWDILGGRYDSNNGTISVPVWHFSRYALCIE